MLLLDKIFTIISFYITLHISLFKLMLMPILEINVFSLFDAKYDENYLMVLWNSKVHCRQNTSTPYHGILDKCDMCHN